MEKKLDAAQENLLIGTIYYFRCSTYASYTKLKLCTSHSIKMNYVEGIVINKIHELLNNFLSKNKMVDVARNQIHTLNIKNLHINEIRNFKEILNKLNIEIDTIYNDKLNGILSEDDFYRIYEKKKQEKIQIENKIAILKNNLNHNIDEEKIIQKLIEKFSSTIITNREVITDLIKKIEKDENKKIYIYFKFKKY